MTPPHTPEVPATPTTHSILRVIVKALVLFILLNLVYALLDPLPALGRISGYNRLFPGRPRLPFGENSAEAYNLSLFSLDAMFAAHEINATPKPAGEYRVILIGDSSTWGFLLRPEQTLSARLNTAALTAPGGRPMRFYNLGYPTISLTKDLLLIERARQYQPDLIIWLLTLESFPYEKQVQTSPIVQHNPDPVRAMIQKYDLILDENDPAFTHPSLWDRTIVGQRRALADIFRLQLYGVAWAATGIDQYYPPYDPPQSDFDLDESFHNLQPPQLDPAELAYDVFAAGLELAGGTPVLVVNEPIYISQGQNSNLRYNFFYPRWAYDQYRQQMLALAGSQSEWHYLDVWDLVPAAEFTNSAIHLTPAGTDLLAQQVGAKILQVIGE